MGGHEKEFSFFQREIRQDVALGDSCSVVVHYLFDRVAGYVDPFSRKSLSQQIFTASLGVRHQNRTTVVDHSTVRFLRDAIVVAAVTGLQVEHRDSEPSGDDSHETTVG